MSSSKTYTEGNDKESTNKKSLFVRFKDFCFEKFSPVGAFATIHLEWHRQRAGKCGKDAGHKDSVDQTPLRPPTFLYTFTLEQFCNRCENLCSQFSRPHPNILIFKHKSCATFLLVCVVA